MTNTNNLEEMNHSQGSLGIKKLEHSAIPSWSGYIYQGLCAVYYLLHLVKDDIMNNKEDYADCRLFLDAYEDFSVHLDGKILSLHQCKLYSQTSPALAKAVGALEEKKKHFKEKGLCTDDTILYFHTNTNINLGDNVRHFEDYKGQKKLDAEGVLVSISDLISTIHNDNVFTVNPRIVLERLISLVDIQVVKIHGKSIKSSPKLTAYEAASMPESSLSYKEIKDCLTQDEFSYLGSSWFWRQVRVAFIVAIEKEIERLKDLEELEEGIMENASLDPSKISRAIEEIVSLEEEELEPFFRRIVAPLTVTCEESSYSDLTASATANNLTALISRVNSLLGSKLSWKKREQFLTPIVWNPPNYGADIDLIYLLRGLHKNAPNLDCLREFDWLVTRDKIPVIKNLDEEMSKRLFKDYDPDNSKKNNIFKNKKIGLLPCDTFNSGKYD